MKIGIDASRAFIKNRTGTENYSYQLINAIAKLDHRNQYILYTRFPNHHNTPNNPNKFPANFSRKNIANPRLWTQVGLAKEMLFHPPDVLFVPAHTLPVIRRPGLKTVVTIHDLGYEYLPQYHQFPQKLYLNKSTEFAVWQSTHLIAVSETTKKDLMQKLGCPAEKITVIYEGFDKEKFNNKVSRYQGIKVLKRLKITEPYLFFVGTLQPRKNIERLIEAFAISQKLAPPLSSQTRLRQASNSQQPKLIIAGSKGWLYDDILAAPKRFGVEKQVKFLGYTQEDDLPALYSNCLALCLPSLFEGFGLPVLEAMACGAPVIVSNTSSLPEVAGSAGLYIDPLNVNDIATKLKLIIENGDLRRKMSKQSLKQAQKFSWEKCARKTIRVLTNNLAKPSLTWRSQISLRETNN